MLQGFAAVTAFVIVVVIAQALQRKRIAQTGYIMQVPVLIATPRYRLPHPTCEVSDLQRHRRMIVAQQQAEALGLAVGERIAP